MQPLCRFDSIDNYCSKGFSHEGLAFFLVRRNKRVFAYINRCPHMRIPLEWVPDQFLDYDGELIQCSTHGALFTIERGDCVYGPCQGRALQALAVEVRGDEVWIDLSSVAPGGQTREGRSNS